MEFGFVFDFQQNDLQNVDSHRDDIRGMVQNFRNILHEFNLHIDMVFDDFNDNKIDNTEQHTDNKCQITHIIDSANCICYAIDINEYVWFSECQTRRL